MLADSLDMPASECGNKWQSEEDTFRLHGEALAVSFVDGAVRVSVDPDTGGRNHRDEETMLSEDIAYRKLLKAEPLFHTERVCR